MIVLGWFWGCSLLRFSVCVRSRFPARRTTQASSAMLTCEPSEQAKLLVLLEKDHSAFITENLPMSQTSSLDI